MRKPDLAPLAIYLARHARAENVLWLGADALALPRIGQDLVLLAADREERIAPLRAQTGGTFLAHDFESRALVIPDRDLVRKSVVVCNDLLARPFTRKHALATLQIAVDAGATAIVTAPGPGSGRPEALAPADFVSLLVRNGLPPTFAGRTATDDATFAKTTLLAIVDPPARRPVLMRTPPDDFSVVAVITAYNEADIIDTCLSYLIAQGLKVYFIDNWSTDDTVARVSAYLNRGVIAIERNPLRDTASFDLERVLVRMEHIAECVDADWFVHYDTDEIRRSAFRGVDLRSSFYAVDRAGFNAVDFTVMNFRPVDNSFQPGMDLEPHFSYFEFGKTIDLLRQRKAWKNLGGPVYLTERAGHDVLFRGRNLYPYKFMNRHYPVRSQAHGERKVVKERAERFNRRERELRQWHVHYEAVPQVPNFVVDPQTLLRYDPATFHEEYLVERLTGIGSSRAPEFVKTFLDHHGESI